MRQSKYEFHETQEQAAARKRVRKFHFGHWRKLWAKMPQAAPEPKPTIRSANGGLEPWAATVVPSPSSKQPRYQKTTPNVLFVPRAERIAELDAIPVTPKPTSKEPRFGRPPINDGVIISRTEINRRYRERQRQIPCRQCGAPSWGGGLCQADYKRKQYGKPPVVGQWLEKPVQQQVQS